MIPVWTAYGLFLGSFINVCVYRIPREESVVTPRSHCPYCNKLIRWYDNLPILSYLLLRARCRVCQKRISPRYPLVEALVGALAAALAWRWGNSVWTALTLVAAGVLVAVAFIDWDTFLIPDELSLGLLAFGLLAAPFNPRYPAGPLAHWCLAFMGAAVGFTLCWAVAVMGERLFKKEAMGGGDIKLLAAVGAWTGALGAFDCLILASFAGAVYGVSLLARKRIKRQDPIPFGPFLSAAAVFNLFYLLPLGWPVNA